MVQVIQDRLRTPQSRHQSYADHRGLFLQFEIGEPIFLRVSPLKAVMWFRRWGKLSLRYTGPFEILRWLGPVANKLALPPTYSTIHPVFHVSFLCQYILDESHILKCDSIELDDHLTFIKDSMAILAKDVRQLGTRVILMIKVWQHHRPVQEATWEIEAQMWELHLGLFEPSSMPLLYFRGRKCYKWGYYNDPLGQLCVSVSLLLFRAFVQ